MKYLILLLSIAIAACAGGEGSSSDGADAGIGTAEQELYLPQPYGAEKGVEDGVTKPTCNGSWAGGECHMPSNKTLDVQFEAGTCDSWHQARVVNAWNRFVIDINGTGFSMTTSGSPKYKIRCECVPGGALGQFLPNLNPTGPTTQLGMIRQYSTGTIRICPANFVAQAGWAGATDTKRATAVENTVRHEMFHMAGWGHYQGTQNNIMKMHADMGTSTSSWFTVHYQIPFWMPDSMECYDPTSDTTPNCPN